MTGPASSNPVNETLLGYDLIQNIAKGETSISKNNDGEDSGNLGDSSKLVSDDKIASRIEFYSNLQNSVTGEHCSHGMGKSLNSLLLTEETGVP